MFLCACNHILNHEGKKKPNFIVKCIRVIVKIYYVCLMYREIIIENITHISAEH